MLITKPVYKTDVEIEQELGEREQPVEQGTLTESYFRRYLAKPALLRSLVTRTELEALTRAWETHLILFEDTLSQHEARIASLENRLSKPQSNHKAASDRNARELRALFGLPDLDGPSDENVLAEMRGMLKEYSEDNVDSVELIHSIRGDE